METFVDNLFKEFIKSGSEFVAFMNSKFEKMSLQELKDLLEYSSSQVEDKGDSWSAFWTIRDLCYGHLCLLGVYELKIEEGRVTYVEKV